MRVNEAETWRQRSPVTARSYSARSTRIGDGKKIGLMRPVPVASCQRPTRTRNATTLIHVRRSMTKPPPRNVSLRSRAAALSAAAAVLDSDTRHQLAVGHDGLVFDQRP